MTTKDFQPGKFYSRNSWGSSDQLAIYSTFGLINDLHYIVKGSLSNSVKPHSTAHNYSDFYESDMYGNKLNNKENKMKYEEITHIVICSKTQNVKVFESEDDAIEYIDEQMEFNPRAKFKIFEPTYKVEPSRSSIKDLLQKI